MKDRITLRFLAAPGDSAVDGSTVQAGSVLEWIDKAGYACAVGWAETACVTAYVGNVHFHHPVRPGELVEVAARVIHTGRTSIHVRVSMASADARNQDFVASTHCILVFVAVDDSGRPQQVRTWQPHTLEDLDASAGAMGRIAARAEIQREMREQAYTEHGTGPRVTLRFLAAPSVVNFGGNAHGGTVMRWIDDAARTCAGMWSKCESVAVYSGGINFSRPVHIGDIVEVEARLIHTGARSMHVAIHVRSGDPFSGELVATTQCMSVLVSKGPEGTALPILALPIQNEEDERLDAHARKLIEMRAMLRSLSPDLLGGWDD